MYRSLTSGQGQGHERSQLNFWLCCNNYRTAAPFALQFSINMVQVDPQNWLDLELDPLKEILAHPPLKRFILKKKTFLSYCYQTLHGYCPWPPDQCHAWLFFDLRSKLRSPEGMTSLLWHTLFCLFQKLLMLEPSYLRSTLYRDGKCFSDAFSDALVWIKIDKSRVCLIFIYFAESYYKCCYRKMRVGSLIFGVEQNGF